MTKTKVGLIKLDNKLYPRHRIDPVHVHHLAIAIKSGASLPPVVVTAENVLVDGAHRIEAYRRIYGDDHMIAVEVLRAKTRAEILEYAARVNTRHGLRLSPNDQARAAQLLLEAGVKPERICEALSITRERYEGLAQRVVFTSPAKREFVVLKRPLAAHYRDAAQKEVLEANQAISGASATSLARQLLAHLNAGTYPVDDDSLKLLEELAKCASSYGRHITQ